VDYVVVDLVVVRARPWVAGYLLYLDRLPESFGQVIGEIASIAV
jgi:hypothetical protein